MCLRFLLSLTLMILLKVSEPLPDLVVYGGRVDYA